MRSCWLYFIYIVCLVLLIACTGRQNENKENVPSLENGMRPGHYEGVYTYINSLDIRMELQDSLFNIYPDTLQMNIINNSDYKLLTDNKYSMKYLESGNWKSISQLEHMIWTDVEIPVEPQASRVFDAVLFIRNLPPGRYRVEKEFSLVVPAIRGTTNNIRVTLMDEFILN